MKSVHLVGCVKRDIMRWVKRYSPENNYDLSTWYCGITHNADLSKLDKYLSDNGITELFFRRWLTNDLNASHEILSFYLKNGMKSRPIKGKFSDLTKYVYIFKVNAANLEEVLKLIG